MALFLALSLVASVAAAPDAPISARAELHPSADSSILGYISTSGASELTDLRSCRFPATLTQSGSYAQCCEPDFPCVFFTSCSDGFVIAESTWDYCNWGYCNTAVIVPTAGASNGKSAIGCWAADLGTGAFDLVQSVGVTASTATSTASRFQSETAATPTSTTTESSDSESLDSSPTSTDESAGSAVPSSSEDAAAGVAKPLTGIMGFVPGLVAML